METDAMDVDGADVDSDSGSLVSSVTGSADVDSVGSGVPTAAKRDAMVPGTRGRKD